jgi:UDP-N-acetylmuramate dehydrogenase
MTAAAALDRVADLMGGLARRDVALGPMTTYRVGGRAALLIEANEPSDLRRLGEALSGSEVATLVVGRGSNLLVSDAGFDGVAVVLGDAFAQIDLDGTTVDAGGAASLPVVARRTASAGLAGFEWAVGVPGSIGGAVRINAGGHGSDVAAVLAGVHVVDLRTGEDGWVPSAALDLGYRRSNLRSDQVVVSARLELDVGEVAASQDLISDIVRWRRTHQPGGQNAGSVFTNPVGDSAGRLIDAAGCKGLRVGSAEVSLKHANFIQADDDGSADDVLALMAEVRRRVLESCGVVLSPETHLVGFDPALVSALGGRTR